MKHARIAWLGILLLATRLAAAPTTAPQTAPSVDTLITQLSDPDFQTREKASAAVQQLGDSPAIRKRLTAIVNAKNTDSEAAERARQILQLWDWGVRPQTPERVLKLWIEYRNSTRAYRADKLRAFMDAAAESEDERLVINAIYTVEREGPLGSVRSGIDWSFGGHVRMRAHAAIMAGHPEQAEAILRRICLMGNYSSLSRDLASLVSLRDGIAEEERALQRLLDTTENPLEIRDALLQLDRMRPGPDTPESIERLLTLDKESPFDNLHQTMLLRAGDWKRLSTENRSLNELSEHEQWPLLAAWLADDQPRLQALRKEALSFDGDLKPVAYSLLFTGDKDTALKLLLNEKTPDIQQAFALLAGTGQWDTALKTLAQAKPSRAQGLAMLYAGRLLWERGQRDQAETLWKQVLAQRAEVSDTDLIPHLRAVGLNERADALAIASLPAAEQDGLNGGSYTDAIHWWRIIGQLQPQLAPAPRLALAQSIHAGTITWQQFAPFADFAFSCVKNEPHESLFPAEETIVSTVKLMVRLGQADEARKRLEAIAGPETAPWCYEQLALLAENARDWPAAARHWKAVFDTGTSSVDSANAVALYRYGSALEKNGDPQGRDLQSKAERYALFDSVTRTQLAALMLANGQKDAALREARLALRQTELAHFSWYGGWLHWDQCTTLADICMQCDAPADALFAWRIAAVQITGDDETYEAHQRFFDRLAAVHEGAAKALDQLHLPEQARRERAAIIKLNFTDK